MAGSTSHLDAIVNGEGPQEQKANALFDAASPAMTGGRRSNSVSHTWQYYGGKDRISGVVVNTSNGTITLSASATNYIQQPPDTGAISSNTTAYTPGYWPLYRVVTGTTTVTSWEDDRASKVLNDTLAKALSDANTTLTQPEAACAVLTFTGTLSTTRDIVVPLVGKRQWTVYNGTGQSLRFIGASGTGITVATLKHAIVRSDGTNIVRVTADT